MEITGKQIFIGVYNGEMNLFHQEKPAYLPSLSIAVFYYEDIGPDLKIDSIEAYFPGDKSGFPRTKLDLQKNDILRNAPLLLNQEQDPDILKSFTVNLHVHNTPILESGRIKVVARIGEDTLRLGSMMIHLKTMEEAIQMGMQIQR